MLRTRHPYGRIAVILILFFTITSCATNGAGKREAPIFYPEPPQLPRIQYLTSFSSSLDMAPKTSAFDRFVTGAKETIQRVDKPYGISMFEGKIYVCDTNGGIVVFDLVARTFSTLQGAQGTGKLVQPLNIYIDQNGIKYVTDTGRGQVVVFDRNDFYITSFGAPEDWRPVDVAAYDDRLYVADSKHGVIWVLDKKTGEVTGKLGQEGEPRDRLAIPTNITIDAEGYLFVSDAGRFQIVKMDRDGRVQSVVGKLGSNVGNFARPRGVAVDRESRIYVVDAAFENVQIFNKEGRLLLFFGKGGSTPKDLFLPAKVVVDYRNIEYFREYAAPQFEIEGIIFVTSQFGARLVSVYALGKEKGKHYPSDNELQLVLEKKRQKLLEQEAARTAEKEKGK